MALSTLPAGFTETLVTTASGFSSPTAMEFSPIGELWVLEQSGNVKLVLGATTATAANLAVDSSGERGLLGIAFDSDYDGTGPNSDYMYLYYTEPAGGPPGDPPNNRLSRFTVSGAGTTAPTLGSEVILRDLPPEAEDGDTNHNGGAIHFGPDGKLYVAVGDHNYDTLPQSEHVSQILTTPFGKILRLNADGTNPDDNPFYDAMNPDNWAGAIWALGLRNPYTFAFNPDGGSMFINDVGENSWEEINLGEAGANYGWSGQFDATYTSWEGFLGAGPPWAANYRDPVMAYDHSNFDGAPAGLAITGGAFYPPNGSFGSDFAGMYFFADYGGNFIRIFDPDNPGQSTVPGETEGDEDTSIGFASGASNPVDVKVDAAGDLYYLARGGGGNVYRISYTGAYGPTSVVARQIFYNHSAFDNNEQAANASDDGAIATDKSAYLPGSGTITPNSVISYAGGITGIMIDLEGNHGPISADDFTFKVSGAGAGTNNAPGTWAAAPAPTEVLVRAGAGAGESDRVEFIWADNAIENRYLEVTVKGNDAAGGFNTNTGLAASDVFYYGSRVGDDFIATGGLSFITSAADDIDARINDGFNQPITNIYDYNKDGLVSGADQIVARDNTGFLSRINITSQGSVYLMHADGSGAFYPAAADTDEARGTAFRDAANAAVAGDTVWMGPGTFNIDATHAAIFLAPGVTIKGAGMEASIIESALTGEEINKAILVFNNDVTMEDFMFHGTAVNKYQRPVGSDNFSVQNAVLRRVKIYAPNASDCLYDWGASVSSYFLYDCDFRSGFSCIKMLSSGGLTDSLYAENCRFEVVGADYAGPKDGKVIVAFNKRATQTYKNCQFVARNDAAGNIVTTGALVWGEYDGTTILENCQFDVWAADGKVYDLDSEVQLGGSGSPEFIVSGGQGSGPAGEYIVSNPDDVTYLENGSASAVASALSISTPPERTDNRMTTTTWQSGSEPGREAAGRVFHHLGKVDDPRAKALSSVGELLDAVALDDNLLESLLPGLRPR